MASSNPRSSTFMPVGAPYATGLRAPRRFGQQAEQTSSGRPDRLRMPPIERDEQVGASRSARTAIDAVHRAERNPHSARRDRRMSGQSMARARRSRTDQATGKRRLRRRSKAPSMRLRGLRDGERREDQVEVAPAQNLDAPRVLRLRYVRRGNERRGRQTMASTGVPFDVLGQWVPQVLLSHRRCRAIRSPQGRRRERTRACLADPEPGSMPHADLRDGDTLTDRLSLESRGQVVGQADVMRFIRAYCIPPARPSIASSRGHPRDLDLAGHGRGDEGLGGAPQADQLGGTVAGASDRQPILCSPQGSDGSVLD